MSGNNEPANEPDDEARDEHGGIRTVRLSEQGRRFAERCVPLTGFELYDLLATGMADRYLETAREQVGADLLDAVLAEVEHELDSLGGVELEVARALTYLWYTGAWPRLAPEAHGQLRREVANVEFVVSPESYIEGLVWRTFNGHPAGAKPPGFATWALRPPPLPWDEPPVPIAAPGPRLVWSEFPSALPPSIFSLPEGSAAAPEGSAAAGAEEASS